MQYAVASITDQLRSCPFQEKVAGAAEVHLCSKTFEAGTAASKMVANGPRECQCRSNPKEPHCSRADN